MSRCKRGKEKLAGCQRAFRNGPRVLLTNLVDIRLWVAAQTLKDGIDKSLTFIACPGNHFTWIRTKNVLEKINREITRHTGMVPDFPEGRSALMLVSEWLSHVEATQWGSNRYLDIGKFQNQNAGKKVLEMPRGEK